VPHLGPVLGEWACHHGLVSLAKDSEHTRQLYWELGGGIKEVCEVATHP
jgi:hypothetical protein